MRAEELQQAYVALGDLINVAEEVGWPLLLVESWLLQELGAHREALRLLILSSKFIFLLEKVLSSAFWCSSSHHANALLKSLILFLYFLGCP